MLRRANSTVANLQEGLLAAWRVRGDLESRFRVGITAVYTYIYIYTYVYIHIYIYICACIYLGFHI